MSKRRAGLGLATMVALILSAILAANASANTAYACENIGPGATFNDAHCLEKKGGSYSHVQILAPIVITGTNASTLSGTTAASTAKLRGTAGGVETEIQCTTVGGSGSLENKEEGATMWAQGTGVIEYTGCSVTKPAGKSCVVKGSAVTTKKLFATTKGLTNQLKFEPFEGTEFASISIEKCTVAGLNNTFPVTGSLIANTSGATTSSTHAEITTQSTLKFAGQKAGLDGSITLKDTNGSGLITT